MNTQTLMPFEQATVDAELAARVAKLQDRLNRRAEKQRQKQQRHLAFLARKAQAAIRNKQEEIDKCARRTLRQAEARTKIPDEHAQCGIRWYCRSPRDRDRGTYWKNCHACGQPLIYTSDRSAKPQECIGRKP